MYTKQSSLLNKIKNNSLLLYMYEAKMKSKRCLKVKQQRDMCYSCDNDSVQRHNYDQQFATTRKRTLNHRDPQHILMFLVSLSLFLVQLTSHTVVDGHTSNQRNYMLVHPFVQDQPQDLSSIVFGDKLYLNNGLSSRILMDFTESSRNSIHVDSTKEMTNKKMKVMQTLLSAMKHKISAVTKEPKNIFLPGCDVKSMECSIQTEPRDPNSDKNDVTFLQNNKLMRQQNKIKLQHVLQELMSLRGGGDDEKDNSSEARKPSETTGGKKKKKKPKATTTKAIDYANKDLPTSGKKTKKIKSIEKDEDTKSSSKKKGTKKSKSKNKKSKQPSPAVLKHLSTNLKTSNPNYRIQRELQAFIQDPPPNLSVQVGTNIRVWIVTMVGAKNTIYEGEVFKLRIAFPNDYPTVPPSVYFLPPNIPVHEHVYTNGDICLSLLGKDWRPTMTGQSIAVSILSILSSSQFKSLPMDNSRHAQNQPGQYQKDWVYHDDNC